MNRNCMNQNTSCQRQHTMNRNTPSRMQDPAMRSANSCANRLASQNSCPSSDTSEAKIPTGSRAELLCFINQVSFAVYEALLYLDTHPTDQDAMEYFRRYNRLREKALKLHAESFGPLTIATADDTRSCSWEWMMQPWPWEPEGGIN